MNVLIGCLKSRDADGTLNSAGGQEVQTIMEEMAKNSYCASFDEITRERYNYKIRTYVGCDPP